MKPDDLKIALLIDGDNAPPDLISDILLEASKHGRITIKRVYGDWSLPNAKSWANHCKHYGLKPIQQFAYVKGKNSTDTALIIDAMDILHSRLVNGFCLVSSDSDYTGLANRIREQGLFIMAIGADKTPEAFVKVCEEFVYTETFKSHLSQEVAPVVKPIAPKSPQVSIPTETKKTTTASPQSKKEIPLALIKQAFEQVVDHEGKAHLGGLGSTLKKLDPRFNLKAFGLKTLSSLLKTLDKHFVVEINKKGGHSVVKLKK